MIWLNVILLVVLGVLGASSVIIKKRPEAKNLIRRLSRISGVIGVLAVAWGFMMWLGLLLSIQSYRWGGSIGWLTGLVNGFLFIALGFVFGYDMARGFLGDEAHSRGELVRKKLVPYKITLGWISLGLALWLPLCECVFY